MKAADFAQAIARASGVAGCWIRCRTSWRADTFPRGGGGDRGGAREKRRAIIWGLGGHVIKCGLAPVLIDLMRRGYATDSR